MNTQQLLCFVCAADHLNFTKAAEELLCIHDYPPFFI